ncbi:early nodulin-93-like [Solanum stenotomum]|uniref:early nodulin-93-like n=1 Tax=Solanum stenotomum TaxID=172797 RepID=UPI0020CFF0D4|nr:early nodulin-93-like [Solanum stenotomum]
MPPITEEQKNQDVQDIIQDGFKGAATTCALTSVVVFASTRYCPWAKANINYAGKTFIISALTAASFAFSAEQSIMKKHRGQDRWDSP